MGFDFHVNCVKMKLIIEVRGVKCRHDRGIHAASDGTGICSCL